MNFFKKTIYIFTLITLFNCEDVIDLKVPTSDPKLVIEASLNWFNDTTGNEQEIRLSLTAPFFDDQVPPANNANIMVSDTNNNTFIFTEEGNTGVYKTSEFIPVIDQEYTLNIDYQTETYIGTEILKSVTPIDNIEQNNEGGFGADEIEIKAFYSDPANVENYYFFEFRNNFQTVPTIEVYEDRFTNGNQTFAFYSDEDLVSGHQLTINNFGVSEQFYQFMFLLVQQTGQDAGGPFQTQPATVRGNCVNITNPDNFPLGYFRVSQANTFNYIVQ